jgi:serine protease Do
MRVTQVRCDQAEAKRSTSFRLTGLAALVTAGAIGIAALAPTGPAMSQKSPSDSATIMTPMGRAPLSFADIVERVRPAVVSISVSSGGRVARDAPRSRPRPGIPGLPDIPDDHPLAPLFKNLPRDNDLPLPRPTQAQGSGFVVSADGYVVTNNHVVEGANRIQVAFDQDNKYEAELIGTDPRTDLALLKIKAPAGKRFQFVSFARTQPRVGDWVVAVGNPFGLGGTVTVGIVSAHGRDIGTGPYDFMQIDAAINKGNSGGPTFNLEGEVVGVNTAIFSPSGGNVGIAFAVPAVTAGEVVDQLRRSGTVSRGWLGVKIQNVDEDTAASLGMTEARGALISEVTSGGPAEASGLRDRDVVLSVNGERIKDSKELARKIAELKPGLRVQVEVMRDGRQQTVSVTLGKFPTTTDVAARPEPDRSSGDKVELSQLGLSVGPLTDGGPGAMITDVESNSDAADKGLRSGDIIVQVGGMPVNSAADVSTSVKKLTEMGRRAVLLGIKRGAEMRLVPVRLKGA